jgi:hypothetical protein
MYLDGGLRFLAVDVATGKVLSENVMDEVDPTTGDLLQFKMRSRNLTAANPDLLSMVGDDIYMKSQRFGKDGKRPVVVAPSNPGAQLGEDVHLFAPGGFLDGTGFHRVHMLYGKTYTGGAAANHAASRFAPAGTLMAYDEEKVFAFSRLPHLHRWVRELEYHVYSVDKEKRKRPRKRKSGAEKDPEPETKDVLPLYTKASGKEEAAIRASLGSSVLVFVWSRHDPDYYAQAMVLAGDRLFVAGPPAMRNEDTPEALERWHGSKGGLLRGINKVDGSRTTALDLKAPPVWDGMAAARGKLFLVLTDGRVICLGKP